MPYLPKEDCKIILKPGGGFRVSNYTSTHIVQSVVKAASLSEEAQEQDTICINYQQNIIVISTPIEEHADKYKIVCIRMNTQEYEVSAYEATPDNTFKGVIRGIGLEYSTQDIVRKVITPRNPAGIATKQMGNTTNVIVLFDGYKVPSYVRDGAALLRCTLYKKQLDMCYQCGRLGHRAEVCPNPNDKICRRCGLADPPENHECKAKCQLCYTDHPTADRECKTRYKTPFLVKKRR
ncbi:hypothetical protein HPB49_011534 [Dermacentor silvarum]|uniref:Uncharacterized protein n=1 Tax=Dermacentor silvarum TaxID=543639 RepID=A0ACB8DZR3_DERSI|nr:hypothetical protein HPB49_011534 [Dermacentor silvarum]